MREDDNEQKGLVLCCQATQFDTGY